MRAAAGACPALAAALALPAATVLHFLAALLALAFSVLWDQVRCHGVRERKSKGGPVCDHVRMMILLLA